MSIHYGITRVFGGFGLMAALWAAEVVAYLSKAGIGVSGETLFYGVLPDTPKFCGAVIPYPGPPAEEQFGSEGVWLEMPRAQLCWRAGAPDEIQAAFETAQAAFELLQRIQHEVIEGTLYHKIQPLQSPFVRDIDESGLPTVAFNVQAERDLTTRESVAFDEGFDEGFL